MVRSNTQTSAAIAAAQEVFWRNGYEKTSVADLVAATGFNRYSLYNTFGGKLEIFLAALDAYYLERKAVFFKSFSDPEKKPIEAIRSVIEYAIAGMAERQTGCFICNVASEVSAEEPIVFERIEAYLKEIRGAYEVALQRAAERNELNSSILPHEGSKLLVTMMLGIGVYSSHGASKDELRNILEIGMKTLS